MGDRGSQKSDKSWNRSERVKSKDCCHSLILFLCPFFLQFHFHSSTSHEALIKLQWATIKIHPRSYWCWYSYSSISKTFTMLPLCQHSLLMSVYLCPKEVYANRLKLQVLTFSTSFDIMWYALETSCSVSCQSFQWMTQGGKGFEKKITKCDMVTKSDVPFGWLSTDLGSQVFQKT